MFRRLRRSWLIVILLAAVAAVIVVLVIADDYTREPPNYSRIEDDLWLGGDVAAPPPKTSAVLNLCETDDPYRVEFHTWEPIRDGEPAPSVDWLKSQVDFIELHRAAGRRVYLHCLNGVSRSAMVVAAYLMRREGWTRDQALEFLRSQRPGVRPNPAFMRLLLEWERVKG